METNYPTARTPTDVFARITYAEALPLNSSAAACLVDAKACLNRHLAGDPFPADTGAGALPTSWLDSASAWIDRAMSHQVGFALPTWW